MAIRHAVRQAKLKKNKAPARRKKTRRRAIEAIWESDDAVRSNLSAELIPVFDQVKRQIRGGKHKDRTEAFLQWVEENPDEVVRLQGAAAERDVEQWIREQEREEPPALTPEEEDDFERFASEPEHEGRTEEEVEAAWQEYRDWETRRAPEHAEEDLSDEQFFDRLDVVEDPKPGTLRKRRPKKLASRRPKKLAA